MANKSIGSITMKVVVKLSLWSAIKLRIAGIGNLIDVKGRIKKDIMDVEIK